MNETTNLQAWFDDQGITLTALAAKLGLSLSYISRVMAGERSVSGDFKWRFTQAYGAELAESLFGNGKEPVQ